jgi:hypothetical protein
MTLSGSILGSPFQEQILGALRTTLTGQIQVNESDAGLQFANGSSIVAQINGSWFPATGGAPTSAPGEYGGITTTIAGKVWVAVRNLNLNVTSPALPLLNTQFDSSGLTFGVEPSCNASFDFNAGHLGASTISLSGPLTNEVVQGGVLTQVGNVQKLVIPISTHVTLSTLLQGDTVVQLSGQLVATHTNLPAINSISIQDQTVVLQASGNSSASSVEVSSDLKQWDTLPAAKSVTTGGTTFSFAVSGSARFYRLVQ